MSQKISTRQLRQHSVLPFIGNSVDEQGDSLLLKIDAVAAKLFEDRNVLLTDGGIVTFTGTQVQFTEALNLVLNQKTDGSAPQVISLAATTRTVSASGRMIYAVIDRTAGTATVTDDATTLPAVVAANQEVFLIAKRIDATDGTQRLYFRNGSAFNAGQSARLGSAGSGSGGSGTGDDLNALTFKASFTDLFDDIPTAALSGVDTGAGKTDATLYSAVNALFQLGFDASKTATTVGTAVTMSGAPTFTVKQGDMFISGSQAKRIATVNSQTSYVLESALSADIVAGVVCISQAVYSKDINNFAGDGLAPSTAFSSAINQVMMIYEDTSAQGDKIFDANTVPVIGWSASSDGTNYTSVQVRPTNLSDVIDMVSLPTAGTNLYVRLFANKTSGSGTVNVLGYRIFFHRDASQQDGQIMNQASALLNGLGTQVNIQSIGVMSGKTRVKVSWPFPVGVNVGTANGSIKVYINGQKIPRFISATATPDAYFTEIDQNTIELDTDYSGQSLLIEIIQDVAVVDASDTNITAISAINNHQFKNRLYNSGFDIWQRGSSTTVANGSSSYLADRWFVRNTLGTNGVITYSRVSGSLSGSKYGASVQITTAPTASQTNGCEMYQTLENLDSINLMGKALTFGVNIKALGNVTQVGLSLVYATTEVKATTMFGSEQSVTVNASGFVQGVLSAQNSGTLPTASGVIGVRIRILGVSSGNLYALNNGFVVEQSQLVQGAILPQFSRQGINTSDEIVLLKRFYEKSYDIDIAPGTPSAFGLIRTFMATTVQAQYAPRFSVEKRIHPTVVFYAFTTGVAGMVSNSSLGTTPAVVAYEPGTTGHPYLDTSLAQTAGNDIRYHFTADAEI